MRGALIVATIAVAGSAIALAATPRSRLVAVGDATLTPASVTILPGGSVTWANAGARSHRVVSDTRAWPAFTLLPGSRRTVRFAKPGLYRYRVDGRLRGSILVVTANGGGNRPGGGEASGKETWRGTIVSDDTNAGTGQTCSATWRGTLAFTVTRGTLNGSGEASLSGTPSCSVKLPTPELQRVTFTVTGTEQAGAAATTLRLLMHPRTVRPSGLVYDAGGFLLHFGKRGEGVPFVLPVHGRKVAASVKRTVGNVTLDDRFVLTRSG